MAVNIGEAYKLGENGKSIATEGSGYGSVGEFVMGSIVPNVMLVANIILFFMIVLSGFMIISGAGNPEKQKQAGQTLTWSVIGFIIVFGAYWIMQALGIITGLDLLNINIE